MAAVAFAKVKKTIADFIPRLRSDFPLYAKYNTKITTKDGVLLPLLLNRMQRVLWSIILDCIKSGKPIRIYLVKARQLGSTTFFSAVLYWLISLNKYKRGIAIAQDDEAAENINLRWQNYYFNSNKELRPEVRKMNPKMIHFAKPLKKMKDESDVGLDSMLTVKTADSVQLGRSFTYNVAHLTEFCLWPVLGINVKQRMIALNQAIPRRANTAIFIETTAQGDNYGKKFWDNKKNGYIKIFVSWLADDKYRNKVLLNFYWELSTIEESHYGNEILERKNIIRELRKWYPESEFGDGTLPDESLFTSYEAWLQHEAWCRLDWRRETIDSDCEGDKDEFKREYPTTVEDAFGVGSKSVFKAVRLIQLRHYIENQAPKAKTFDYIHQEKDVKTQRFFPAFKGALRVYEPPKPGFQYVVGADGAQGVPDGDDSSLVVLKITPNGQLLEVASFNANIEATEFAGVCYHLSRWYNTALLGIERNDKGGFAVLELLKKHYHYSRLYWYKNPLQSTLNSKTVTWGWTTNDITRQLMIRDMKTWIERKQVIINSSEIIEQMDTFVENPKTHKIEASAGNHDDLVIALMIAGQLSKQIHIAAAPADNTEVIPYSGAWWTKQLEKSQGVWKKTNKKKVYVGQRRRIAA